MHTDVAAKPRAAAPYYISAPVLLTAYAGTIECIYCINHRTVARVS